MIISINEKNVMRFKEVNIGECFMHNGKTYIRIVTIDTKDHRYNAIDLSIGEPERFCEDTSVRYLESAKVIANI